MHCISVNWRFNIAAYSISRFNRQYDVILLEIRPILKQKPTEK